MQIRRVKIKRYRGIESLTWFPGAGINCLIGPGDVGKSTILEAIGLVLSPAPGRVASEHDFLDGDVASGFKIELLMGGLDESVLRSWPVAPLWTWFSDDQRVQADPDPRGEGVLCLRAVGTEDLEVEHVVVDPSDGELSLSPSKRRAFGLSRISPANTAYRELRMSRGSLLSRNVEPDQLRGLVTQAVQATRDAFEVPAATMDRLTEISTSFREIAPGAGDLDLGMLSPPGQNLLSLVGLFGARGDSAVPLSSAGLGTQQLALFTLARLLVTGSPLFVADEIENGLEPFRQRDLIGRIRDTIGSTGQAFITTHSPAAVGELSTEELYRVSREGRGDQSFVVAVPTALDRIRDADPEALLCRIPLVLEGTTEIGVLGQVFEQKASEAGTSLGALGIRLVDGGGQPNVFGLTDGLLSWKERFGAFLDEEDEHQGKRAKLAGNDQVAFGTYTDARCLEEALSRQLSIEDLDALVSTPDADGRDLSDARYQQLNHELGAQSRKTLQELAVSFSEERLRDAFSKVADKKSWFKTSDTSVSVGRFLIAKRPDLQIVRDAEAFWESAMALISAEVTPSATGEDVLGP